jgi:acetyl-CoA carboxylase biotin carboxylase subunit
MAQVDVTCAGHAIECRINAEDPKTFMPSAGVITALELPKGEGVRVDTHVEAGYKVSPYYDSLIAKLIVHGQDRADAMQRTRSALASFKLEGIATNLQLLRELFEDTAFAKGETDIHYLEKWLKTRGAA